MKKSSSVFLVVLFLLYSCSKVEMIEVEGSIPESEPNDQNYSANEISQGNIYRAEISKPENGNADKDVFKAWYPAGTVVSFEIESSEEHFQPYIGHTDNLSHAQFVIFSPPGKFRAEFITSVNGWQYFEIGDIRNTSDKGEKVGDFAYYFRIASKHICGPDFEPDYTEIKENKSLKRGFSNNISGVDIVKMTIEENGVYQIKANSKKDESDKFSFVFNCDAGDVVAGNDDEDYYSGLLDPVVYSLFQKNHKNLIVTGRLLTDLSSAGEDEFSLTFLKQPKERELEPNNLFNMANVVTSTKIEGELDSAKQLILGELTDDQDWFKLNVSKGEVLEFSIKTDSEKEFLSGVWFGSYLETGTSVIPLRLSMLSGNETHKINMLAPFSGDVYLHLEGSDVRYSVEVKVENEVETLLTFNNSATKEVASPDCGWRFFKWSACKECDFFKISLDSFPKKGGLHVFDSDYKPLIFLEPEEVSKLFLHRYEKTEQLFFGLYFDECEQNSDDTMIFKISKVDYPVFEWDEKGETAPVKFEKNGSYQGYFNTDELFVENLFEVEVKEDGTLYLQTAPSGNSVSYHIDTVITLFKNGEQIGENDDTIPFVRYNRYSYLKHGVKRGEKYIVKVTPFMTESSHVPSMNIVGNYILDIIIE
ncbi:MAG: hypothetical protein ACOX2F_05225 [bacterium]